MSNCSDAPAGVCDGCACPEEGSQAAAQAPHSLNDENALDPGFCTAVEALIFTTLDRTRQQEALDYIDAIFASAGADRFPLWSHAEWRRRFRGWLGAAQRLARYASVEDLGAATNRQRQSGHHGRAPRRSARHAIRDASEDPERLRAQSREFITLAWEIRKWWPPGRRCDMVDYYIGEATKTSRRAEEFEQVLGLRRLKRAE